jgi:hypothetical protein
MVGGGGVYRYRADHIVALLLRERVIVVGERLLIRGSLGLGLAGESKFFEEVGGVRHSARLGFDGFG